MEQTTIKKRSKTAICSKGTMAFIIDFKTTCKPKKYISYFSQAIPKTSYTVVPMVHPMQCNLLFHIRSHQIMIYYKSDLKMAQNSCDRDRTSKWPNYFSILSWAIWKFYVFYSVFGPFWGPSHTYKPNRAIANFYIYMSIQIMIHKICHIFYINSKYGIDIDASWLYLNIHEENIDDTVVSKFKINLSHSLFTEL